MAWPKFSGNAEGFQKPWLPWSSSESWSELQNIPYRGNKRVWDPSELARIKEEEGDMEAALFWYEQVINEHRNLNLSWLLARRRTGYTKEWVNRISPSFTTEKDQFFCLPALMKELCGDSNNSAHHTGDIHVRRFWAPYLHINVCIVSQASLIE